MWRLLKTLLSGPLAVYQECFPAMYDSVRQGRFRCKSNSGWLVRQNRDWVSSSCIRVAAAQVSVGRYGNTVFERTLCLIACIRRLHFHTLLPTT